MEALEAKILLKNLLKRIRQVDLGSYELSGNLTDDEFIALNLALAALTDGSSVDNKSLPEGRSSQSSKQPPLTPAPESASDSLANSSETMSPEVEELERHIQPLEIDISTLNLPDPPNDRRLCLDFGTAMSKVTLIKDATPERGYEDISVLHLGVPGDQEEVSLTMLVSSVFIDTGGFLWFGQMAVNRSRIEEGRKRLDNIKHYLSVEGDGLNSKVNAHFNPSDIEITYGDMVLAYLMFLSWSVSRCLDESGEPRNLYRRFAMPCFEGRKYRDMERVLRDMLGEAQILADTFYHTLQDGIHLTDFATALSQLRRNQRTYSYVKDAITEPLGVAGSIMSWKKDVNSLIMVIDVGAGTSDFSLYRMHFDEKTGKTAALEVENSSEGITEAGNYLDTLLRGLILQKAGVTSEHQDWVNIYGNLELDLRDYKERLFVDGEISVRLFNDDIVSIALDEFLSLEQVARFGNSLKDCRDRILNRVHDSFIEGAPYDALGLALTGGGASLPMVKALADGMVRVRNKELRLVQTQKFPVWLAEEYPELEADYPRIAVSLGGARQRVIARGGIARITAGDVKSAPTIGGYYTKGS